jgi:hypothetical protein
MSNSNSVLIRSRALSILLFWTTTVYFIAAPAGLGLAFLHLEKPATTSDRTLTFEERVSYQRAIEEVYWRHRIWPKERPDPKPSLDAVMTQAQLRKKVEDYLRKSQAVEDERQRPISAAR